MRILLFLVLFACGYSCLQFNTAIFASTIPLSSVSVFVASSNRFYSSAIVLIVVRVFFTDSTSNASSVCYLYETNGIDSSVFLTYNCTNKINDVKISKFVCVTILTPENGNLYILYSNSIFFSQDGTSAGFARSLILLILSIGANISTCVAKNSLHFVVDGI